MWVASWNFFRQTMNENRIEGYNLANNVRDSSKDILLEAGNDYSTDIWSDGVTMWVTEYWDDRIYAYSLATKQRIP